MEKEGKNFDTGTDISSNGPAPESFLRAGYLLKGRYEIQSVLGEGGFGITYKCLDVTLGMPVAVKEYYPRGYVLRDQKNFPKVTYSTAPETMEFVKKAKNRFLDEARVLAKFSSEIGIVNVRDYFEENNTAYIVMEFLNGKDLGQIVKQSGIMPADYVVSLFLPVMESLEKIHSQGLIHRDISPDNVRMVGNRLKLLDFGAARDFSYNGTKTMTVLLKRGYAPIEQYGGFDKQGPWTDVYALCATMYYCITGKKPTESTVRWDNDPLQTPSQLGIAINPAIENVIMKGLSVSSKDRYQSVRALAAALNIALTMRGAAPVTAAAGGKKSKHPKQKKSDSTHAKTVQVGSATNINKKTAQGKEMLGAEDFNGNKKEKGKSKKKGKIIIPIIAVVLIAAIVVGVLAWRKGWFAPASAPTAEAAEETTSTTTSTTQEETTALPERKVYGTIKQSSNLSVKVSGATVKIYQEDELITTVMSDASGGYEAHLEEGEYRAEVTVAGYKDYKFEFEIGPDEDTEKEIVLEAVPTGTVMGYVRRASDGETAISGATITVYDGDKAVLTAMTNSEGKFTLKLPEGGYLIKASNSGYVDCCMYAGAYVDDSYYLSDFLMVAGTNSDIGTVKGKVRNIRNDKGVSGVTLTVKKYWNNSEGKGETVKTATTDSNGNYSLELPYGNYTVFMHKDGCEDDWFTVFSSKDTAVEQDGYIYIEPKFTGYTVTLTWDDGQDLDLWMRSDDDSSYGGSDWELYYAGEYIGYKDCDDTDGYGPETYYIEIEEDDPLYFYVYTQSESYTIQDSNAVVTVTQIESGKTYQFTVPDNGDNYQWDVCTIKGNTVTEGLA